MSFTGKTAIITGGASGMGKATAVALAKNGANVVIADINTEMAQEVIAEIVDSGGKAVSFITDVTRMAEVKELIDKTLERFGRIDYLCNSAGLQTYGTVETTDEALWDKTMDVNLKSMFLTAKCCIPEMRKQGGGAIVNITSVQGIRSQRNAFAYGTSKGAVISMTRAMALDYAPYNIRVNCICPGAIDTPMLRFGAGEHGDVEEVLEEWGSHHPIGRIGQPEEIANTVLFLLSDQSSFMIGQPVIVDGGLTSGIF